MRFLPYDTPGAVARFFERTRPRLAIILENRSCGPICMRECARRGVALGARQRATVCNPAAIAALDGSSAEFFSANVLIAAQTAGEDAERFNHIGADRARTHVVGNVKFDLDLGAADPRARAGAAITLLGAGQSG